MCVCLTLNVCLYPGFGSIQFTDVIEVGFPQYSYFRMSLDPLGMKWTECSVQSCTWLVGPLLAPPPAGQDDKLQVVNLKNTDAGISVT